MARANRCAKGGAFCVLYMAEQNAGRQGCWQLGGMEYCLR